MSFFTRWLCNKTIDSAARRLPPSRQRCRLHLEALEDRCVLASGWIDWQDWPGMPDSVNPGAPSTSDVISFTFFDHSPWDFSSTTPSLSFDLINKAIDVVFVPTPGIVWGGGPVQGLAGRLWALDTGDWILRGPQSNLMFTVTGDPLPWIEINDLEVAEGDSGTTGGNFTVSLSTASEQTVTVDFATVYGGAQAGIDYAAASGVLTFAPGETTKTITVQVNGDTRDEYDEDIYVSLQNPTNARLGPDGNYDFGRGIIRDDDSSLTIHNPSRLEGNSGITDLVFAVSMIGARDESVTVEFATADGTAQAGNNDYIPASGLLTFAPGETTKTIKVQVNGDTRSEFDETFFVNLSNPTNATIADGQGQGTVRNDDAAPSLTINDVSLAEGNSGMVSAVFTVTLSAASENTVTVDFTTAGGSAVAGSDYHAASGTLTFAPGETSKTITFLVSGDRLGEPNETFFVNISSPTNATIADGQAVGTILDDEPRISISDVTKAEGKKGQTTLFTFTVTLSAAYDQAVTMSFATVNGTAKTSDGDYIAKSGTLTFPPGQTTKTITIEVKGDSKREANETFYLDLFGLSDNGMFTKNRGLGTILNDD